MPRKQQKLKPEQAVKLIIGELKESAQAERDVAKDFATREAYGQAQGRAMRASGLDGAAKHVETRYRELMGLL